MLISEQEPLRTWRRVAQPSMDTSGSSDMPRCCADCSAMVFWAKLRAAMSATTTTAKKNRRTTRNLRIGNPSTLSLAPARLSAGSSGRPRSHASKPPRVAVMKNPWGRVLHPGYDAARHVLVVRIGTNSSVRDSSPEPDGSTVRRPGSAWKQYPGELLLGRHTGKGEFDHVGGRDEPCRASCELEDVRLVLVPLLGLPVPVDRVDDALLGCARHGVAGVQQGVRFVFGDRGRDGVGDLVESRFVVVDQGVDRDDSTHLLALRTGRRATVEGVVRVGVARPTSLGFRQVVLVLFSRVVVVVAVVV